MPYKMMKKDEGTSRQCYHQFSIFLHNNFLIERVGMKVLFILSTKHVNFL